jgi:RHS repeat-associated protein
VEKVWAQNYPIECTSTQFYCNQNARNPYVKTEFISIKDKDGQYRWTAIKDYSYDKNGNVTQVVEYDWVPYESVERESPSSGNYPTGAIPSQATPVLKRITATGYYASTPDASANLGTNPTSSQYPNLYIWRTSPRLRSTSAWSEVRNGSNQAVTRTENSYDDPFTTGNLTQVKMWDSFKGGVNRPYSDPLTTDNSISISTQYNQYGMPILTTDARGTQTQIIYGPIAGPNGTVTDLYPTETKAAYNTSVQKIARMEYDFYTGLVTRATDVDNNVSLSTVYDALGRPTLVKAAEGTAIETRTATEYNDAQRYVVVRADLNTTGDGKRVSIQNYDQLGRVRLSRTLEDSATQSAYNESDGVKIQTRYLYSGNYSYQIVSNPYRAATSSQATNELTMGWSRTKIDNGGRVREIETFSGASLPSPLGSNTSSTGVVVTDYDANTTTVKEQSGKRRKSETNALGQLVKVTEDPNLTGYTGLNYETTYTYDTLSNLVQVNQGVQTRTFTYSSLGRLLTATNPEGGIITYTYDSGGNLLTKRDARNITTTFTYDELSRIRTRSYSDGITPAVTYTYDDSAVAFGKGKLTKVSSSVSETRYASYDPLGRVTSSQQITAGLEVCPGTTQLCSMSYVYNLAGALVSQTYPSGRVVKNVFDNTGDLLRVFGKLSNKPEMTYASEFKYTPSGSVNQTRLGNGRWESTQLNSRLQPVQIALGTTQNATDLLKLNYEYGELDQSGNVDTTKNNGNVVKQTITVPQMAHPLVQNYSYDVLNRVTEAKETSNGSQQWIQTFTYDRYGNRRIDSATNKTTSSLVGPNPVISETNNRIVAQQGEQYDYDSAGNLTKDKDGNQFFYDAENRQVTYRQAGSPTDTAYYAYDGDGRRVKKVFNSITTIFVYSASGKLVEEYETTTPPTNGKIQYLTNDMLGSPRVLTDASGQVTSRRDFHPFGEEIIALGGRTSDYKYSQPDNVNQKFTGQLRDAESGLDYFNARYYASAHGRFTSVDPIFTTLERLIDPQQINLYIYTRDNPLRFVDPSGMILELEASSEDDAKAKLELLKKGLKPKDRNHIQLVVGDGKNGFAKGTFGITVDKNHKSNSGNFNAIKKISEDTGATAELAFRGPNDKVDVYFGTEKNGKVQLVSFKDQVGQDFHLGPNEGAVGWTAMPAPNPVVPTSYPNYSADNKTRAFVFTGQSDVEVVKTIFHELAAHVALSNVGRDPSKGKESDPVVQKEIKRAESEAAKNFKQK